MNPPDPLDADITDELQSIRRALEASAHVPPLTDLTHERIRHAAQGARKRRQYRQLAIAASVALLLGSLPFLHLNPPQSFAQYAAHHPLLQDPLLTELDLLDLQLLELTQTHWSDSLFPTLEDLL